MSGWRALSLEKLTGFKKSVFLLLIVIVCGIALLSSVDLSPPRFRGQVLKPKTDWSGKEEQPIGDSRRNARELRETTLSVAIAPVISPEASFEEYKLFVDYLGKALGMNAKLVQRKTYAETNELVRYGTCQLAFVCTYAFVRGEEEFGMVPLAIPVINGSTYYQSFIIVSSSSKAKSLLDLRGRTFASADLMSTSGWLYPALWLLRRGRSAKEFFSEHVLVGSHDRAIRAVAAGMVEAAAVDSIVYSRMVGDDPSLRDKVRIIQESPHYGMPPIVSSRGTDPEFRKILQDVVLGMKDNRAGRRVLFELGFDRFERPDPTAYDLVRDGVREWEEQF